MNLYGSPVVGLIEFESRVSPQALATRDAGEGQRSSPRRTFRRPSAPIPHVVRADVARLRRQLDGELAVFRLRVKVGRRSG